MSPADLFGRSAFGSLLAGLDYRENFVSRDEERGLIDELLAIDLAPFRFHGWTGNGDQVTVGHAFRTHEGVGHALLASLTQQQTQLGMVTTEINQIGVHALELGDHGRIIAVTDVDTLIHDNVHVLFLQGITHLCGHARAVSLLVMQHGNGLGFQNIGNVIGRERTLLVVTPNGAEKVMGLDGVGYQGRGGAGSNGHNAFLLVNVNGRHGGT